MTDIFNTDGQPPVTPPVIQAPSSSDVEALLDTIKNEQGQRKYQNITEAMKALQHSQEYIPTIKSQVSTLEQELQAAKAEAAQAKKLEDIVAQLTNSNQNADGEPPPAAAGLGEADVIKLVQQSLVDLETQRTTKSNVDLVQTALTSKFGDKTAEVVASKAKELGTTPKLLGDLAAQSPQLVLSLFGTAPVKQTTPTTSSVVIPPVNAPDFEIKRPDKSVLTGAGIKQQAAHFKDIQEKIHAKLGVTS